MKDAHEFLQTAIAGGATGFVSRLPTHPIDTLKASLQSDSFRSARDLFSAQGVRGLYRGFGVAVIGAVPASTLYFTTFEAVQRATRSPDGTNTVLASLTGGFVCFFFSHARTLTFFSHVSLDRRSSKLRLLGPRRRRQGALSNSSIVSADFSVQDGASHIVRNERVSTGAIL